ncbi:hypothetical protein BST36_14570 [Mycolicibacterium moriokaense]|uniref:Uncharacterized protein n=1 Tax=Mycolicibacterium moriokaense TaxID=39691 RepID=A0AAD1HC53_9MYCO|nr:hypothetical protein [Mycolicibacterium moriokaense]MCV7039970.1 hypothetical protein [Mycolicibacterium moriokaense]ORB22652.1 hypothetical protein BST36_14570 [Mycolicibacterium moriokaense]BBX02105.1 hypothetical protein MMOR_30410 [Mycolicibacterium moriokaense]
MTGEHPDISPELRQLAQSILDQIDPLVRLAAARASSGTASPGKCQQVWCPVCALAALATGEQHPLLTVVADHSVALLSVIRAILDDAADTDAAQSGGPSDAPPDGDGPPPDGPPPPPGRYQHIPVTVEE